MNEHLSALIHEIFGLNNDFRRIRSLKLPQALNPPATPAEIDKLEGHLSVKLPPSYRDFLTICNGWVGFNGNLHMLSIDQQMEGEYARYIQQWKREQWEYGEPVAVEGIVFGIALNTNQAYLFDIATVDGTGEMEAIWWDDGEHQRSRNLTELLEAYRDIRKVLIDRERDKRR